MGLLYATVAAADCAVGDNIIAGHFMERANHDRMIVGIDLTGSTAAGDCVIDIKVGGQTKAQIPVRAAGAAVGASNFTPVRVRVPSGELVEAVCSNAAVTNPVFIMINLVP